MGTLSRIFYGTLAPGVGDQVALFDLDLKTREALIAHAGARRALARAVAAARQETGRRATLAARVAELEDRGVLALRAGRSDMAAAAAEAIAALETELEAATRAVAEHDGAIARLRHAVEDQRRRLADIDRGRRLAEVRAALNESRDVLSPIGDRVAAAEQALEALVHRQNEAEALAGTLEVDGARLVEDMAEAGFGPPLRPMARDVLARIRARADDAAPVSLAFTHENERQGGAR